MGITNLLTTGDFKIIFAQSPSRNTVFILSCALSAVWKQEVKLCPFSAHITHSPAIRIHGVKGKQKEGEDFVV